MGIRNFLQSRIEKGKRFKEMQEDLRMRKKVEEREKTSEERQLERYFEDERQKRIKQKLDGFKKKDLNDFWHGHSFKQENIFAKKDFEILKQPNLFKLNNGNMMSQGMFFK